MFDKCDCLFDKSKQALIMSQRPIMAPLRKSTLSAILPPSFPDEMGKNEAKTPFFGISAENITDNTKVGCPIWCTLTNVK